jgi:hypothetical protein
MLSAAPRVFNRLDTAFAQQLQMCEVQNTRSSVERPVAPNRIEAVATKPEPKVTVAPFAVEAEDFGDVLIVEDEEPVRPSIVSGRNFRQLFSSLERKPHRVG